MTEPSASDTRAVYDRRAADYDQARSRAFFEARWLTRFADSLPEGGRVTVAPCLCRPSRTV